MIVIQNCLQFRPWIRTHGRKVGYGLVALGAAALIAGYNELLFHTVTEGFSIILAALIYVLAVKTFRYSRSNPLLLIGYAYFFAGLFYVFHIVTYAPLNIFPGIRIEVSNRINGFGYFLQAVAFLAVPLSVRRRIPRKVVLEVMAAFSIMQVILVVSSVWDLAAPFKFWENASVIGKIFVISILATAGWYFYLKRKQLNARIYQNMTAAIFFTTIAAVCELFFLSSQVLNWVGHAAKIAANLWVYKLVITFGIEAPYDLIFKELKNNVILDTLTGIYNRNGLFEFIKKELLRGRREDSPVGILLIDLDNFKGINDRFGHLAGDKVLKSFAAILKTTVRESDIVCRFGGDEFIVLLKGDGESLDLVRWRIQEAFQSWQETDEIARKIGLSIGSAIWESDQKLNIEWLLNEADLDMYNEKTKKKVSKKEPEMVQLTMFGIDSK